MPNENIIRRVVLSGTVLLPETNAWLAVLPSRPSPLVINAVNTFIKSSKASGNWQLLDRFWLFGQDIQANVVYSIVNPTATACVEVNSPTWAAYQGFTFNGSNMYLRTNYIPSTNGVNYTLNNAAHGLYCTVNTAGTFGWDMGTMDGTNASVISLRDGTNSFYAKMNNASANLITIGSITDSRGLYTYNRTASNLLTAYKNGVSIGTDSDVSTARPTTEYYIGAFNNNGVPGSYSNKKIAIAFTSSASISNTSFYTEVQALATALTFNV